MGMLTETFVKVLQTSCGLEESRQYVQKEFFHHEKNHVFYRKLHSKQSSCEHSSVADTFSPWRTIYSQPSDASGGVLTSLIMNLPGMAGLGWLTLEKHEGDAHTLTQSVEANALSHCSSVAHSQWANQVPETKETQMNNGSGDWFRPVGHNSCGMIDVMGPFREHCL